LPAGTTGPDDEGSTSVAESSSSGTSAAGESSESGEHVDTVSVTAHVRGDGLVEPLGVQVIELGADATFEVVPRTEGCTVELLGTCAPSFDPSSSSFVVHAEADCDVTAEIDCGPSSLELWPPSVGLLYGNETQQFTATQVFESGARVDITDVVDWSSSDPTAVAAEAGGVARAVARHGIVDISAVDPGALTELAATTPLTVVDVTEWRNSPDCTAWTKDTVRLESVVFDRVDPEVEATSYVDWQWGPRPWEPFDNGISGVIWFFWSYDDGLTYTAQAWDYIGNDTTHKGMGGGSPANWMGMAVSTLCVPDACNGMDRSNIMFGEYPYATNPEL